MIAELSDMKQVLIAMLLAGWLSVECVAQSEPESAQQAAGSSKKIDRKAARAAKISAAREQELLNFVYEHHPELAELLKQLKPMNSDQYRAALSDLDRDVRRIESVRKRSSGHSEAELNLWKSRSRIRLLSARLTVSSDEVLRSRLRDELRQLRQLELDVVQRDLAATEQALERQRLKLEQLQARADELQGDEESWVERKLSELERKQKRAPQAVPKKSAKAKSKEAITKPEKTRQ